MVRAPCCEKVGLRKGRWTDEEDHILTKYIQANGEGSWRSLPKNAGLLRCGKSCRLRWINYLRTDLKRGNISAEEEKTIVKLHSLFGNRWSLIAGQLPGRTDNEIKNYWNSHLSRKLYTPTRPSDDSPAPTTTILDVAPPPKRRTAARTTNKNHNNNNNIIISPIPPDGDKTKEPETSPENEADGDLGPYEWLDGETMRLNNEIEEWCSSSVNSGAENEEWGRWGWEDHGDGGFLEQWEFEEISSWLWGGGDDQCFAS